MITKLKAALEALNRCTKYEQADYDAITDLRTVIAQLEQSEPVAWMVEDHDNRHFIFRMQKPEVIVGETLTPLYTHSAPDHKPLGEVVHTGVIRWSNKYPQVGTKLYAAPVQPVREAFNQIIWDRHPAVSQEDNH